jgi:hypothetical protein
VVTTSTTTLALRGGTVKQLATFRLTPARHAITVDCRHFGVVFTGVNEKLPELEPDCLFLGVGYAAGSDLVKLPPSRLLDRLEFGTSTRLLAFLERGEPVGMYDE